MRISVAINAICASLWLRCESTEAPFDKVGAVVLVAMIVALAARHAGGGVA